MEQNKKDRQRAARDTINGLKTLGGNLLEHIVHFYSEKGNSCFRQLAEELTLDELVQALPGFRARCEEELSLFIEPHIKRCDTADQLTLFLLGLEDLNVKINPHLWSPRTRQKWSELLCSENSPKKLAGEISSKDTDQVV